MEKSVVVPREIQKQQYAQVVRYTDAGSFFSLQRSAREHNKHSIFPVVILSDIGTDRPEQGLRKVIGGMEFRGFLIEDDAVLSRDEMEYLMSRIRRWPGEEPIFKMDSRHKNICAAIIEDNYRKLADKVWAFESYSKTAKEMGVDCDFSS